MTTKLRDKREWQTKGEWGLGTGTLIPLCVNNMGWGKEILTKRGLRMA